MTEEQIICEIERYLDDTIYNYAVLIDGEWGSGKTYFVKHSLKEAIEKHESAGLNRKIKYVSLYGCKGVSDLQERLILEFADEIKQAYKEKKKSAIRTIITQKGERFFSAITSSFRKIGVGVIKRLAPEMSLSDFVWDWFQLKSNIFVFDDLERCDSPLNEIFGFVNNLVEHEDSKVVFVANENEISYSKTPVNIEQQYMLSVSDKIIWPEYDRKANRIAAQLGKSGNLGIGLDELDFRRRILFPSDEFNSEYKKFREKLIGVTLKYEPDNCEIIKTMIRNANCSAEIKEVINRKLSYLENKMDFYRHHNLRTVQFFLSKVAHLLTELNKIEMDEEHKPRIEDYVVKECFIDAVKLKSNFKESDRSMSYSSMEEEEVTSKTILDYVEKGQFVFEEYAEEIETIIEEICINRVDNNDPFMALYYGYYYLPQHDCESEYEKMISKLKSNRYPISIYGKILVLAARLELIGFCTDYSLRIIAAIIDNIGLVATEEDFKVDLLFIEDKEIHEKVDKFVEAINDGLKVKFPNVRRKTVSEILTDIDWVDELKNYIRPHGERYANDMAVFSQADPTVWINAIITSSSRVIHDFRSVLSDLYPRNFIRKSFATDWPVMLAIHDAIEPNKEKDLIKRQALKYVIYQIEEVYSSNTGNRFQTENISEGSS